MSRRPYVSDPKMWEEVFKDMASGQLNPYVYARAPPTGRGLGNRYRTSFYIPVKSKDSAKIEVPVQQITPNAAVAERAKVELKREKKEKIPHVDPKAIKKNEKSTTSSRAKTTKRVTSLKRPQDIFDEKSTPKKKKQ